MSIPVVPMRVFSANIYGLQIRVCKYADPDSGKWSEFVQVRRQGQPWGEAAPLELVA